MFQKLDDHRRALVALLFAVLVIIGVLMLPLRTSGGDESVENKTLSINIKAYADLLLPEDSALRQLTVDPSVARSRRPVSPRCPTTDPDAGWWLPPRDAHPYCGGASGEHNVSQNLPNCTPRCLFDLGP